ncbi:MAG: DUF917 domain-containing protein [Thermomicrobiales bacterium]
MPWHLTKEDVQRIATGAGILGTGGGGNPYRGMVRAIQELEQGRVLTVVRLDELADDALIVPLGGMGAPTIGQEKIGRGDEGAVAVQALSDYLGVEVAGTAPIEIGGGNSFAPMIASAQLGLVTVDVDGMGRAFPETSMISYYFDGIAPSPIVMIDERHQKVILEHIPDTATLERISRAICVQLGGRAMIADKPMTVQRLRETGIPDTIRLAHTVGSAVEVAQSTGGNPVAAICEAMGGMVLFSGKLTDVDRRFERGYNFGRITLDGLDDYQSHRCQIELQNEFLICRVDGETTAIVPDLITLVDTDRGTPITTEVLRYGLRATVIGIPAPPQLTTAQALGFVGPQAFGYDEPFVPLEVNSRTR